MAVQSTYTQSHTAAMPGVAATSTEPEMLSQVNADSVDLAFGDCVQFDTSANGVAKLASGTPMGILVRAGRFDDTSDVSTDFAKVKPGKQVAVATHGIVWVRVTATVTRGAGAHAVKAGGFRETSDAVNTVDISTKARFLTAASADGLAMLQFDFV